jgi:transposase
MSSLSAPQAPRKRRRYTKAFKARIINACQQPGASVSRVALDHGLNANLVRRWIKVAEDRPSTTSAFVPVPLSAPHSAPVYSTPARDAVRIQIPRADGAVIIEWPADQATQCLALLRELLA